MAAVELCVNGTYYILNQLMEGQKSVYGKKPISIGGGKLFSSCSMRTVFELARGLRDSKK